MVWWLGGLVVRLVNWFCGLMVRRFGGLVVWWFDG